MNKILKWALIFASAYLIALAMVLLFDLNTVATFEDEEDYTIYYNEQGILTSFSDKCLKEIVCQAPNTTETVTLDFKLLAHESCYDLINDPDNIKEKVNKIFEEYPSDWNEHMNWTPHNLSPTIRFITNNNLTEITCENIYVKRSELG